MSNYKEIKLTEWQRTGEGASACSYVNKSDDNYMLKLFNKSIKFEVIKKEYEMSQIVDSLSVCTPVPYEIVTLDEKYGIIYQNIKNKKSITKWLLIDFDKYIKVFASETRKLHEKEADVVKLKSQKELLKTVISNIVGLSKTKREKLDTIINNTSETKTCIHGDLSTGNLIVANDKAYWIDLADFAYGNPLFDIGMIYFDCKSESLKLFRRLIYKMPLKRLNHIWDVFIREYLNTDDINLINEFEEKIKPYAALSVLNYIYKSNMPKIVTILLVKIISKAMLLNY